jgi:hypothetical protein
MDTAFIILAAALVAASAIIAFALLRKPQDASGGEAAGCCKRSKR